MEDFDIVKFVIWWLFCVSRYGFWMGSVFFKKLEKKLEKNGGLGDKI
jgi:hypothetical protein